MRGIVRRQEPNAGRQRLKHWPRTRDEGRGEDEATQSRRLSNGDGDGDRAGERFTNQHVGHVVRQLCPSSSRFVPTKARSINVTTSASSILYVSSPPTRIDSGNAAAKWTLARVFHRELIRPARYPILTWTWTDAVTRLAADHSGGMSDRKTNGNRSGLGVPTMPHRHDSWEVSPAGQLALPRMRLRLGVRRGPSRIPANRKGFRKAPSRRRVWAVINAITAVSRVPGRIHAPGQGWRCGNRRVSKMCWSRAGSGRTARSQIHRARCCEPSCGRRVRRRSAHGNSDAILVARLLRGLDSDDALVSKRWLWARPDRRAVTQSVVRLHEDTGDEV